MATNPTPSQISCLCQMVVTKVGTSVCPAEWSVASPYAARATTTAVSGRSISVRRRRIAAVRWQAWGKDGGHDGAVLFRDAGEDLHGGRPGVGREHDSNLRRGGRGHADTVPDQ